MLWKTLQYTHVHCPVCHTQSLDYHAFLYDGVFVFGCNQEVLQFSTFKMCSAFHVFVSVFFFNFCTHLSSWSVILCCSIVLGCCLHLGVCFFLAILCRTFVGYLHLCNTERRCSCSFLSNLGMSVRILITLYLDEMSWLMSQCRHWSVWIGFLHTLMEKVLSGSWYQCISKEHGSIWLVPSTMNFMAVYNELMCSKHLSVLLISNYEGFIQESFP